MKKTIFAIFVGVLVVAAAVLLTGCSNIQEAADTQRFNYNTYENYRQTYNQAFIFVDGEWILVDVDSYGLNKDNGVAVVRTTDGMVYSTHLNNIVLIQNPNAQ